MQDEEHLRFPVLRPPYAEDHPLLAVILDKRREAAGTFTPEFSGQRFADFDRGLMCAFEAVNAVLQNAARHQAERETLARMEPVAFTDGNTALVSIVDERIRQIEVKGWTPEHDDEHDCEDLARAAACYAVGEMIADAATGGTVWPWHEDSWKPTWPTDRRRELVKAGALIVAEIERLDRRAILESNHD